MNSKSMKRYIAFAEGEIIHEVPPGPPGSLANSKLCKNASANDKALISLPAMNFEVFKSQFLKLHKQEEHLSQEILAVSVTTKWCSQCDFI